MAHQRTKVRCRPSLFANIKGTLVKKAFLLFFEAKMRKSRFMLRLALLVLLIAATVCVAIAQVRKPSFDRYIAKIERPRAHGVDFRSDAGARAFRTRLSHAFRGGVNFAGHYIVAGWGCGTGCISGAIIDSRTGKVFWPLPLYALAVWYAGDSYIEKPVEFRRNSRLLVIRGSPGVKDGDPEKPNGEYYYEWTGRELRQIGFFPYKSEG